MSNDAWTKHELSDWLACSPRTVERWGVDGVLPSTVVEGGDPPRYRREYPIEKVNEIMQDTRTRFESDELVADLTAEPLLTKYEVAGRLRATANTVVRLSKHEGMFPRVEFRSTMIRYHPEDIAAYIEANKDWTDREQYGEVEGAELATKVRLALGTRFLPGRQLLTTGEAAKWMGLGLSQMRSLGDDGEVPWVRLRPLDLVRFDAYNVQEAIERRRPERLGAWAALPGGLV